MAEGTIRSGRPQENLDLGAPDPSYKGLLFELISYEIIYPL